MLTLAHAGHWAVSLIYFAPVAIVVGALALMSRRENPDAETPTEDRSET